MDVTFIPTTGGNFKVCLMGHVYRYQKTLSDGTHRWKCFKAGPKFHCLGHIRTDTRSVGLRVPETGAHSASCDPDPLSSAPHNAQRDIIIGGRKRWGQKASGAESVGEESVGGRKRGGRKRGGRKRGYERETLLFPKRLHRLHIANNIIR